MNNIISSAIWFVHLCMVILVMAIPFTNSPYFLLLHSVFIPFMILHWVTNNNTCVLTTAEKYFKNVKTKEDEEDCFTCKLIYPIFDFKKNHVDMSKMIYCITIGMWLISVGKIAFKYNSGEFAKLSDLFVIVPK